MAYLSVGWFAARYRCAAEAIACRPEMRQLADVKHLLSLRRAQQGQPIRKGNAAGWSLGRVSEVGMRFENCYFWRMAVTRSRKSRRESGAVAAMRGPTASGFLAKRSLIAAM